MTVTELKGSTMNASDKQKALDAALGQIERAFGKGSIMKLGADNPHANIEAISTGSLGLDIGLGIGGLPRDVLLRFSDLKVRVKQRWPCKLLPRHKKQAELAPLLMRNMHLTPLTQQNWVVTLMSF